MSENTVQFLQVSTRDTTHFLSVFAIRFGGRWGWCCVLKPDKMYSVHTRTPVFWIIKVSFLLNIISSSLVARKVPDIFKRVHAHLAGAQPSPPSSPSPACTGCWQAPGWRPPHRCSSLYSTCTSSPPPSAWWPLPRSDIIRSAKRCRRYILCWVFAAYLRL